MTNVLADYRRSGLIPATVLLTLAFATGNRAFGQDWPTKPIRVIVPITAGSAADIVPRTVFEQVAAQLGQPIIVENRPGAGGTTGATAVARSDPDGHTLLAMSSSYTIAPAVFANLAYDAASDLKPVLPLGGLPNVLVVAGSAATQTVGALVAAAKSKPGALNYASVGMGTATHLNAERFRLSAGISVQHVPFKGAPEALTEVMTGRIDFSFMPVLPAMSLIREGKLSALAVGSTQRASSFPEVPTTIEAGFANSDFNFWLGVFAPSKTPDAIINRLYTETRKALQLPSVRDRLAKLAVEPMLMSRNEFQALVTHEIAANAELAKAAGLSRQ